MKQAIFLDRDGVINEVLSNRVRFVNQPKDLHLLPGVGEAIYLFNQAMYPVFVVTNQGGVGLGYMREGMLHKIHEKMLRDLATFQAKITDIAYCPHKPHANCICRKPKPEMLFQLANKYHIDLSNSYMVGDRAPDIDAGRRAGTKTVLIGNREYIHADYQYSNLLGFARWLTA